jgi:SAM-dependent methyltransferase
MRLHVGCGSVFLAEWTNVDLPLKDVFLAKERPDLVERFLTTEDNYYGRHDDKTADSLRGGPVTKETCCDVYGSFAFLPARDGTVSEIYSVQCFEHLDRKEAVAAVQECARVLKTGGILRIDIPDADETIRQYRATGDEFFLRHLFGPRRNLYGFHTHYTRDMLRELVHDHGFDFIREDAHQHFYPAFALRFIKV